MMKNGARDYLVKDRHFLDSLSTVVVRVLREAETERKLAEAQAALARTQSLLLAALDQTPAGIIVADAPDGRTRLTNKVAEGLLGVGRLNLSRVPLASMRDEDLPWQSYRADGTPCPIPRTATGAGSTGWLHVPQRRTASRFPGRLGTMAAREQHADSE